VATRIEWVQENAILQLWKLFEKEGNKPLLNFTLLSVLQKPRSYQKCVCYVLFNARVSKILPYHCDSTVSATRYLRTTNSFRCRVNKRFVFGGASTNGSLSEARQQTARFRWRLNKRVKSRWQLFRRRPQISAVSDKSQTLFTAIRTFSK